MARDQADQMVGVCTLDPTAQESVEESIRLALSLANPNDLIVPTGSITVVAEVIENLEGIQPETYPWLVQQNFGKEIKSD